MEKISKFEEKLNFSIDLLELAKSYCDVNYDKSMEVSTIATALELVILKQKELVKELDYLLV